MEVPEPSSRCQFSECKHTDFELFKCFQCQNKFCLRHRSNHNCAQYNVLRCPVCNINVPVAKNENPNTIIDQHIEAGCKPVIFKCSLQNCSFTTVNNPCYVCNLRFCIHHHDTKKHSCGSVNPAAFAYSTQLKELMHQLRTITHALYKYEVNIADIILEIAPLSHKSVVSVVKVLRNVKDHVASITEGIRAQQSILKSLQEIKLPLSDTIDPVTKEAKERVESIATHLSQVGHQLLIIPMIKDADYIKKDVQKEYLEGSCTIISRWISNSKITIEAWDYEFKRCKGYQDRADVSNFLGDLDELKADAKHYRQKIEKFPESEISALKRSSLTTTLKSIEKSLVLFERPVQPGTQSQASAPSFNLTTKKETVPANQPVASFQPEKEKVADQKDQSPQRKRKHTETTEPEPKKRPKNNNNIKEDKNSSDGALPHMQQPKAIPKSKEHVTQSFKLRQATKSSIFALPAPFNMPSSRYNTVNVDKESSFWKDLQDSLTSYPRTGKKYTKKFNITHIMEIVDNSHADIYNRTKNRVKHWGSLNALSVAHLTKYPIQGKAIDKSINEYQLFYAGDYTSLHQSLNSGVIASNSRFGKSIHLFDSFSIANEYTPCSKCGKGDLLSETICDCTHVENYCLLMCQVTLGNLWIEKVYQRDPERQGTSILVEDSTREGSSRYRHVLVWDNSYVLPKYLIFFNRK